MATRRISTRNLAALPPPRRLRQICKALALLDAIRTPDMDYRVYTYDVQPAGELASMQSHSGDMFAIWFDDNGVSIRGFELHSALGHPDRSPCEDDLFEGLPDRLFDGARGDYAHGGDDLTFVLWCGNDDRWHTGKLAFDVDEEGDVDGSETCLWMLADDREIFLEYDQLGLPSSEHHEADVAALFEMRPISAQMVSRINPDAAVDVILALARSLGWPVAPGDGDSELSP